MSHNTWIHRLARVTIVRPLIGTRVTPNQLTTVRLGAGIAAALCLAVGDETWHMIGAGVFAFSMLLDRADGDYARTTGMTSTAGHKYDLVADSICNAIAFIGLGIGLRASELAPWAVPMGVLAGGGVAAVLWIVMRIEDSDGARAAELGGAAGFDPDDAMLAVPIGIWLGWSAPLLLAASIGAPAFAMIFFFVFRRKLFG